jgi:hypothetical protein
MMQQITGAAHRNYRKHQQGNQKVFPMKSKTLLLKKNLSTKTTLLRHTNLITLFSWAIGSFVQNKVIRLKNQGASDLY